MGPLDGDRGRVGRVPQAGVCLLPEEACGHDLHLAASAASVGRELRAVKVSLTHSPQVEMTQDHLPPWHPCGLDPIPKEMGIQRCRVQLQAVGRSRLEGSARRP